MKKREEELREEFRQKCHNCQELQGVCIKLGESKDREQELSDKVARLEKENEKKIEIITTIQGVFAKETGDLNSLIEQLQQQLEEKDRDIDQARKNGIKVEYKLQAKIKELQEYPWLLSDKIRSELDKAKVENKDRLEQVKILAEENKKLKALLDEDRLRDIYIDILVQIYYEELFPMQDCKTAEELNNRKEKAIDMYLGKVKIGTKVFQDSCLLHAKVDKALYFLVKAIKGEEVIDE